MLAFHSSTALKIATLEQIIGHIKAGHLRDDLWWDGSGGCAVGITIESDNVSLYPQRLGIPLALAALEMKVLVASGGCGKGLWFPLDFIEAIEVGANLSDVAQRVNTAVRRKLLEIGLPTPDLPPPAWTFDSPYWRDACAVTRKVDTLIDVAESYSGLDREEICQWLRDCTLRQLRSAPVPVPGAIDAGMAPA